MQKFTAHLLAGAAVGMLYCGAANAQTTQEPEGPASQSDESDDGFAEIVVTAERREQSVQRSSLAINVVGADDLARAGVTQPKDLATLVPGVSVAGGNTAQSFIRGVGDAGSTALGQSAVSYNYDGIYISDLTAVFNLYFDLERVEVLKGPQGTLYGRNSSAGAINIIPRRPQLGEISGDFMGEVGNYDLLHATGGLNVPLSDNTAVRASFNLLDRDGYISDGSDDDVQQAGRLQLLTRSDRLSVLLAGDYAHRGGTGPGGITIPRAPGNGKFEGAVDPETNAQLLANGIVPPFLFLVPGSGLPPGTNPEGGNDAYVDHEQFGTMIEANYDLGGGFDITLQPAYRESDLRIGNYSPGVPFIANEKTEQFSAEARLAFANDWLDLVAGAYYLDISQQSSTQVYLLTVNTSFGNNALTTQSKAIFGQGTFSLTPDLRVIAGGRYTWEDRTINGSRQILPVPPIPYTGETTFKNFSYRAGVEYDVTPTNMLYATASRGFKSGGFNTFQSAPTQSNVYDPELLYSYTLGMRNRFGNTLQLNVEAFYWDYQNGQTTQFGFDPTGSLQFLTFNAASAEIYGAEGSMVLRPFEGGTLSATLAYLSATYDDFQYDVPNARYNPVSVGCPATAGPSFTTVDCSGFDLPRSPDWSGTVNYEQEILLPNDGSVIASAGIDFASSRELSINYIDTSKDDGYVRGNAYLTYVFPSQVFSLTGFINNIWNEEVPTGGIPHPFAPTIFYANVAAPRTYGLRATASF